MADVNDIVCLGFGSWSTVNGLPTLGFAIGTAPVVVVPDYPGVECTLPVNRPHHTLPENLPHATLPINRPHYTIPAE